MDEPTTPLSTAAAARSSTTVISKKLAAARGGVFRVAGFPKKPVSRAAAAVAATVPTITGVMSRPELPETTWPGGAPTKVALHIGVETLLVDAPALELEPLDGHC